MSSLRTINPHSILQRSGYILFIFLFLGGGGECYLVLSRGNNKLHAFAKWAQLSHNLRFILKPSTFHQECALAWHGMAWHGMAWHGMAWHGMAWHGMAWHGIYLSYKHII